MTLLDALGQVPDFRKAGGKRHPLQHVLVCMVLSLLSGNSSWRGHEDFARRHHAALQKHLRLEWAHPPSYSTFRRVMEGLDFTALQAAFLPWARQQVPIEDGEWLSGDGKSLRGTMRNACQAEQSFTALVSLFSHKRGLARESRAYLNQDQSEVHVMQALLATADLEGAGVSLDALHCTKKPAPRSAPEGRTT